MTGLSQQLCVSILNDSSPMTKDEIAKFLKSIPDWNIVKVDGVPQLKRGFKFKNFVKALAFANKIGEIAEEQGHHPLIELTWGHVTVTWWTHDIQGLHLNDFIMAAKTSEAYQG